MKVPQASGFVNPTDTVEEWIMIIRVQFYEHADSWN
jgi:hypothetical protein